ncbi:MAG: type IV pilus biogenesis protein PilM, partial [Candidatus Zixiibacteriota bacterium]
MSIKIAQLSQKRGDLNLSLYGRQDISKGLIDRGIIKDEKKLIETIKKAVKGVKGDKIRTNYAVCSLPEQEAFVRVVQLPILKKEELREAVKWEMEENIPLAIDEVYFDYSIVRPVRDKIDHFDILIGALPKKIVDDYVSVLEKSGIKIKALEIESIATSRALIKDGLSSRPVLIVDIGSQRTGFT